MGVPPYWQGFESNFAGYDLLSQIDRGDHRRLLIEVKTSVSRVKDASFFVTRHEWDTALRSDHYLFHLWALKPSPNLLVVEAAELRPNIPADQGSGVWKQVWLQMAPFSAKAVPVPPGILKSDGGAK